MQIEAMIFDLDDTLVVEQATSRSSMHRAAMLAGERGESVPIEDLFQAVRSVWSAGPLYQQCLDLGISSWEALWSTFEGNHRSIEQLRDWAPSFRRDAWLAVTEQLGRKDPALAEQMDRIYIESQRNGHPLIEGAEQVVRTLGATVPLGLLTNGPSEGTRRCIGTAESTSPTTTRSQYRK